MPIYEYRCGECGLQKEFLQRMSDAPLTVCPSCGKPALTKMLSAAGFQLKGTGWYATDFRNKGTKSATAGTDKAADKPADAAKPAEAATATKESPKTEASSSAGTTPAA